MSTAASAGSASAQGWLSTHVLDTMRGQPAAGMTVRLYRLEAGGQVLLIKGLVLNADGRADAPLLAGEAFLPGRYRLVFAVAEYFRQQAGVTLPEPAFLDEVPLDFGIADAAAHYHVPLLTSPWSYSTYRGS